MWGWLFVLCWFVGEGNLFEVLGEVVRGEVVGEIVVYFEEFCMASVMVIRDSVLIKIFVEVYF